MATRFPKEPLLLLVFLAGFCFGIGPEPPAKDEGKLSDRLGTGLKRGVPSSDTGWFMSGNRSNEWSGASFDTIHDLLDVYNVDRLRGLLENGGTEQLGDACAKDAVEYARAFKEGKPWAMAMSDSSGRYSSQFFLGDGLWLGSMTLCGSLEPLSEEEEIDESTPRPVVNTVEHTTSVREKAPFPVSFMSVQMHMSLPEEFQPTKRMLTLGVCVPNSCASSTKDAKLLVRFLSGANETTSLEALHTMKEVGLTILTVRKVPGNYDPMQDKTLLTLLVSSMILLVMVISGTILELLDRRASASEAIQERVERNMEWLSCEKGSKHMCNGKRGSECNGNHLGYVQGAPHGGKIAAEGIVDSERKVSSFGSTVKGILLCFSLRTNVVKLFEKTPPADHSVGPSLGCLHGLRVFSLVWVITGHGCLTAVGFSDNKSFRGFVEKDFLFQSVSNGAFSVDTFFFISGFLVSYLYFKAMEKASVINVNGDTKSSVLKFFGILTYRFVRLTPAYLFAIGLSEVTSRWLSDTSVFPPPVKDFENCHSYWWRNVFYINTFYPVKDMCMVWSWYLSDDTQFYTLGVILLIISSRYFKTAVVSGFLLLVSSWVTTGVITFIARHSPSIEEPFSFFDELYDKPWTRLGPYMVGMAVGWLLTQDIAYKKIHKLVAALMWTLSSAVTFALVYGLYGRNIGPLESAAHTALSHTTWGLAIAWIVLSCSTGRGGPVNWILSNRFFVPLSRLSFCAYLIHPLIMFAVFMHSDAPIHLTRDTMVMTIGGFIVSSYLLAFVISMTIEAPSMRLLDFAHPIKKQFKEAEQRSRETSSTISSTRT